MKSLSLARLLYAFFLFACLSTALQLVEDGPAVDKRAAPAKTDAAASTSDTTSSTTTSADTSVTDSTQSTGTNTASHTKSGATTETGKHHTITSPATITPTPTPTSSVYIDPRLPPGGISMLSPSLGVTTYYRVGNNVTFAWNYTSLIVTPTAVNVIASCSLNSATYTISSNMSVHQTQSVIWDTGKYQATATVPLLTASYTLIIWDASKSFTDIASAGYLMTSRENFAMYVLQPYTSLPGYQCATCNSARSDLERNALKFAAGMVTLTILSFTWFTGGAGLFSA